MVKEKLRELRKKTQVSQKEMADILCIDVSNYNKREKGICRITSSEWELLAKKLNVEVEDIYEPDDMVFYKNNNKNGIIGNGNTYNTTNETVIIALNKYILKLEEENTTLKTENTSLQENIALLEVEIMRKRI